MLDGWSAKRFSVPEEDFVDGERVRAFDAQPAACCSLRAAGMQRVRSLAVDLRTHARGSLRVIQAPRDCGTNDRSQGTAVIAGRRRAATMLQKGVSIAADATRRPRPIECLGQGIEVALPTPS